MRQLGPTDRDGIEACALGFVVAREIIATVDARPSVLISGRMYVIFRSVKKGTATAFIAHLGNGNPFNTVSKISNFVGFVPRFDQSGNTTIYGRIHKRGCSTQDPQNRICSWGKVA